MRFYLTLPIILLSFFGCVNKHGVSMKYYSDCKEYYDLQGYYHKECGEDDIFTYESIKDAFKEDRSHEHVIEGKPSSF